MDAHAIWIKNLELHVAQLSTNVNPRQPGSLPSNTIQNPIIYGQYMAVTTRGGKQTIDLPMSYVVEDDMRKDEDVVEASEESVNNTVKEAEFSSIVPLMEGLEQLPGYVKFMKDIVTKKISVSFEDDDRIQHCTSIATRSIVQKKEDPGAFAIPCTIGLLGLDYPKPTMSRLLMVDRMVKSSIGILHDVLVKGESFIFSADFVILDCEVESVCEVQIEDQLAVETLATLITNFDSDGIEEYGSLVASLERKAYRSKLQKLELDMKHHESAPVKTSTEEASNLELKALPHHLRYVFLCKDHTFSMIIAADLNEQQVEGSVAEGIVEVHRISQKGKEVDRVKVEVIEMIPPPISVKGVRSLLGHAGFYQRFKDFSETVHPLCKLLEKERKFYFDESCLQAFGELKKMLVYVPILFHRIGVSNLR
ncbi:uncharacterized protein LOC107020101 [Solanum pennellii]|uniref:Uncharacterized protein LOC107020101 n=1 Tax=Solanum pennellii TaxID=28526 RepID=A0ABM1GTU5_SOLPN|nr:uncharacterized protein LOC107020101 [Solanum pennellii]